MVEAVSACNRTSMAWSVFSSAGGAGGALVFSWWFGVAGVKS